MPKVYSIESDSPNAFATGRNPQHATVAPTTGIRRLLTREELGAVMAHEMAHVITQQRGIFDGHGPIFVGFLVELIHKFMGRTEGTDLQWNLLLNSVEVEYNNI